MKRFIADIGVGLRSLAFPIRCVSCDELGVEICANCIQLWHRPAFRSEVGQTTLWTAVPYNESVARVVLRAKENQNQIAQSLMAEVFARLIIGIAEESRLMVDESQVCLIPIPSSRSANRRRGGEFLIPIIERTGKILQKSRRELSVVVTPILKQRHGVRDQSGLSQEQRLQNMNRSIVIRNEDQRLTSAGSVNILLDDVITTGSTLQNALRVLDERKVTISAAITACASQRRLPLR